MPFRYRRSLRLARGLRVNLSKTGASVSVGGRGLTRNVSRRGVQTTVGVPGTGLSYRTRRRSGGSVLGGLIVLAILLVLIVRMFGG